jgi:multisubunit Na+/H+ antiporter MnhB subunit
MLAVGISVLALMLLALGCLTAAGERRRGSGTALAVVAGLCFPVTWVRWYVVDEYYDPAARR